MTRERRNWERGMRQYPVLAIIFVVSMARKETLAIV
jgi:hypothetical protein